MHSKPCVMLQEKKNQESSSFPSFPPLSISCLLLVSNLHCSSLTPEQGCQFFLIKIKIVYLKNAIKLRIMQVKAFSYIVFFLWYLAILLSLTCSPLPSSSSRGKKSQ